MLVTPYKLISSSIQVFDVLILTVHGKLINFAYIYLQFLLEIPAGFTAYTADIITINTAVLILRFGLKTLNILRRTMAYISSIHNNLD
jgi:hypothetical protein